MNYNGFKTGLFFHILNDLFSLFNVFRFVQFNDNVFMIEVSNFHNRWKLRPNTFLWKCSLSSLANFSANTFKLSISRCFKVIFINLQIGG